MPSRTYVCPRCGRREQVILPMSRWNAKPPRCRACASRVQQEFVAPGIRGANYAALKIAEAGAIAQSEGPRPALHISGHDMNAIARAAARVREDITEHRVAAPTASPQAPPMSPATRMQIEGAMPSGRAYRAAHGVSPIERYQRSVDSGAAFDANRLLGGRRA